jgi:hypothetical protein
VICSHILALNNGRYAKLTRQRRNITGIGIGFSTSQLVIEMGGM